VAKESFETQVFPPTVIDSAICFEMHCCRTHMGQEEGAFE
jgi:hypothetical protein